METKRSRRDRAATHRAAVLAFLGIACLLSLWPAVGRATLPPGKDGRITYQLDGDVWIMGPTGAQQTNLTNNPSNFESLPAFAPTGRRILFFRNDPDRDLFTMNPDGLVQVDLTNTPNTETEFSGVYFPDGRRIAFSLQTGTEQHVWVMNANASGRREVTAGSVGRDYVTDVSPDGRRILYSNRPTGSCCSDFDIWVVNADGTQRRQLTDTGIPADPVYEQYAAFSPNGKKIVFDRCDNFDCDILLMNANGTGETPLADDPASSDIQPIFSANGKRIIFKNCFSDCDIASIKLDGTGQVGITDTDTLHETVPDAESIQLCGGRRATILGDDGPDHIKGTKKRDVIDANGGQDVVRGRGGKDIICGGDGPDKLLGGKGRDRLFGGNGSDALRGGPGPDKLRGGPGRDLQKQ